MSCSLPSLFLIFMSVSRQGKNKKRRCCGWAEERSFHFADGLVMDSMFLNWVGTWSRGGGGGVGSRVEDRVVLLRWLDLTNWLWGPILLFLSYIILFRDSVVGCVGARCANMITWALICGFFQSSTVRSINNIVILLQHTWIFFANNSN